LPNQYKKAQQGPKHRFVHRLLITGKKKIKPPTVAIRKAAIVKMAAFRKFFS